VNAPLPGYDPAEAGRLRSTFKSVQGGTPDTFPGYKPKTADEYNNPYQNEADLYEEDPLVGYSPARLTDIPTSTTDVSRPRTVAAGYDEQRGVMTVMFRDGTLYNYYEVTPGEWSNFSNSISKGRPWLNKANSKQGADGLFIGKPRGPADISQVSETVRNDIYRIARTTQVRYASTRKRPVTMYNPDKTKYKASMSGTASTRVKYRSGLSPNASRTKLGSNPNAKNGRNPNQK